MSARITLKLDGHWQSAEATGTGIPKKFEHRSPVPGLIDQSEPPFEAVSPPLVPKNPDRYSNFDGHRSDRLTDPRRDYFWYRRTFQIAGPVPPKAYLKVHKAMFGTRIILNGADLGTHLPNFTPGYFEAVDALLGEEAENEILIRIGAARDAHPSSPINGHDHEKNRYLPGIPDTVELILSGTPFIRNLQIFSDPGQSKLRLQVELEGIGMGVTVPVRYTIRPDNTSGMPHQQGTTPVTGSGNEVTMVDIEVQIEDGHWWSPEDPFLYHCDLETSADSYSCRFGMRSFRFDPVNRRALLNDQPYYLRGTNICIGRFYEDTERGNHPWERDWVRRLFTEFKKLNWNSFRFCLGPPPEFWYDLADEFGFIVQDEFPVWDPSDRVTAQHLVTEYTEWMRERWNHACVLIWDAQNETPPDRGGHATSEAIATVRDLDLSDRPWDNGWSLPDRPTDPVEVHPYLLNSRTHIASLDDLGFRRPEPRLMPTQTSDQSITNPRICNEYGWMWIDREGRPGLLSQNFKVYENFLWDGSESNPPTAEEYRYAYARTCAILTEYWRAFGNLAGVQHFTALSYSRKNGHTSDSLIDVAEPRFETHFMRYLPDAFAPVAIVLDLWRPTRSAATILEGELILLNDSPTDFGGSVRIEIRRHENETTAINGVTHPVHATGNHRSTTTFQMRLPDLPGRWRIVATLQGSGEYRVRSIRDLRIR